jgi:hypothetical protein
VTWASILINVYRKIAELIMMTTQLLDCTYSPFIVSGVVKCQVTSRS